MSDFGKCKECGSVYVGDDCPACAERREGIARRAAGAGAILKPGHKFHGFEIISILGRGGMGVVYKARQKSLGRTVALKVLPPERTDQSFAVRFEREARALATLSHSNIVTIFDSGQEGDLCFFSMELVEGETLRERLARGRMEPGEAVRITMQICEALEYAHGMGIIHRDIKPANILMDERGRVKIADFGLAKLGPTNPESLLLTDSGAMMGTAAYMAPEQMEDARRVDHRADIYSTGVLLYEMLTGERPMGSFDLPSTKCMVPASVDDVVMKALAKNPAKRYESAARFKSDLATQFSDAPTVVDTRTGTSGKKRNLVPLYVLLALTLIGVPLWYFVLRPAKNERTGEPKSGPSITEDVDLKIVRALLPEAAAMDRDIWNRIPPVPSPERVRSQGLTYILLMQDPPQDISYESRQKLLAAIHQTGRISILQPDFIRSVSFQVSGDRGHGTCSFESGDFSGNIEFTALRQRDGWTITGFHCPRGGERTVRGVDGEWEWTNVPPKQFVSYRELFRLPAKETKVRCVGFSPDGRWLLSAGDAPGVSIWEMPGGQFREILDCGAQSIEAARISPDGLRLAALARKGRQTDTVFWDWQTREKLSQRTVLEWGCLAFSRDGKDMAVAGPDGQVIIFARGGEGLIRLGGHEGEITDICFAPDDQHLASAGVDGTVRIWNRTEKKLRWNLKGHDAVVESVVFDPKGKWLASAGEDRVIRIWSVGTGDPIGVLKGHTDGILAIDVDSSGRWIASVSKDGTLRLWDTETWKPRGTVGRGRFLSIQFSPDGKFLVSGGASPRLVVWGRE